MHQLLITALYFLLTYAGFTILLAFIEKLRIKANWGKVVNINHWYSFAGAVAAFIVTVAIFHQWNLYILCLALACIGVRGVFYDPSLNLFLGRYIDAESESSNNKSDALERKRKISFWMQRLLYLILTIAGYLLFYVAHLIFK